MEVWIFLLDYSSWWLPSLRPPPGSEMTLPCYPSLLCYRSEGRKAEGQSETLQAESALFKAFPESHKSLHLHLTDQVTVRSPPTTSGDTAMCLVQYKSLLLRRKQRRDAWITSVLCRWAGCYRTRDSDVGGNQHIGPTLNEDLTASESGSWHLYTWFKALLPFFKTLSFFETQLIWYDTLRKSSLPTTLCPTSHSVFPTGVLFTSIVILSLLSLPEQEPE